MALEECVKQVVSDDNEDDDVPLIFKRNNCASKQSQLSSAPRKGSSQKRDVSSGRLTSAQSALNGQTSNSQKVKAHSTAKVSTEKSTAVGASSLASQSRHSSVNKMASNEKEMTHLDKSHGEAGNSDDDDKPLSCRRNPASASVLKSNSMHAKKPLNQSSGNKLENKADKMISDNSYGGAENSDDFDKKSNAKNSTALRNTSLNSMKVLGSPITTSPGKKIKEDIKDYSDDSEDDKPLSFRFQSKSINLSESDEEKPLVRTRAVKSSMPTSPSTRMKASITKDPYDSDDEKPLILTRAVKSSMPTSSPSTRMKASITKDPYDSDDEKPLVSRLQSKSGNGASTKMQSDSDEEKPLISKLKQNGSSKRDSGSEFKTSKIGNKRPVGDGNNYAESSLKKAKMSDASSPVKVKLESVVKNKLMTDDNDHIPIAQRLKMSASSDKKPSIKKVKKVISSSLKKVHKKSKKTMKNSKYSKSMTVPPGSGGGQKWTTLQHNGVIFPPPYKSHGVKMLYNGQPVDLTPEQEEVATMFAVMKDTDYATKPKFIENFMNDWREILGRNHVIKKFELCDFTPIHEWHLKEKEKKKQMSTEEKKALKEEKLKQEDKYMWAVVDGVKEKVGNFRVEPPGLFRGRGEHPKMGKLKKRIRPREITINIGKDAPIPECPIPGERWKEIRHDNTVTWLAYWNDPINGKEFKYVFLAASSSLKGQSDKEKYEKARLLKDYIHDIRATYTKDFSSKDATKRQIAVATYLIDKLALRAGNEKDDDEADTVGCCTLKVENVVLVPPNKLLFDFLGKDSIRYFNTVEVELPVYKAIGDFRTAKKHNGAKKSDGDDLFDMLDTNKLNAHLKELMPCLTAKVFRTYNASITLDEMLSKETKDGTLPEKIAVYQHANKEVAIICNHQRAVSKSHDAQMSRLNEKIDELKAQQEELKIDLSRARKGKPPLKDSEGKTKKNLAPEVLEKKLAQVDVKIEKMELDKTIKEDLKTVALGTSKINYLDPRITVAWCKRREVPIEKMFNKSLLAKFSWAMDVEPTFRF